MIAYGIDSRKIRLIPNGVELGHSIPFSVYRDGETFDMVTTSRLTGQKNLFFLLDVMEKLPSKFTLQLFGEGPDEYKLSQHVIEKNLSNRVLMSGVLHKKDLLVAIRKKHLFLLPSLRRVYQTHCLRRCPSACQF